MVNIKFVLYESIILHFKHEENGINWNLLVY